MNETARFQETLRKLAIVDEALVGNLAGLGLDPAGTLDTKTISLLQLAVLVATGSPGTCLEWSTARAMTVGATDDEIADVLLAIAPWPASAGWSAPLPTWRPRSGMTSGPRWKSQTIADGSSRTGAGMAGCAFSNMRPLQIRSPACANHEPLRRSVRVWSAKTRAFVPKPR